VEPILIPLAANAAHPFPFISDLGLNLAVRVTEPGRRNRRFVRIKVPANGSRWVPLEQVIADNLSALFPRALELACFFFRVTRGAKDDPWADQVADEYADLSPGAIIGLVTAELTARRYAGVVRLEVSADMPESLRGWLATQLGADPADVIAPAGLLSLGDLTGLPVEGHAGQRYPAHEPTTHPRLRSLDRADPSAIFDEIRRGDIAAPVVLRGGNGHGRSRRLRDRPRFNPRCRRPHRRPPAPARRRRQGMRSRGCPGSFGL
jgi:polyphosphate kinase